MAFNISNSTKNTSFMVFLSASDCIPWVVVNILECLAIVILNIITIIVFVKQRQLQRRSTYLMIHLAVVDLLVGAISGPLNIYSGDIGYDCKLWKVEINSYVQYLVCRVLIYMLPLTSLVNLVVISLERFYAVVRPFRHRVTKEWVYGMCIGVIWLVFVVCGALDIFSLESKWHENFPLVGYVLHCSYYGICLLVICVNCISSLIQVQRRSFPTRHDTTARERRLTVTLFMVAFASLLSWLPLVVFSLYVIANYTIFVKLSPRTHFHIRVTLTVLSFANSFLNPIVYALRMPEFRRAATGLFRKPASINRVIPVSFRRRNLP